MAVAVNNTDNVKSEDFSGVQSLAGVSFGSAASDRIIGVWIYNVALGSTGAFVSSVTIGGVTANKVDAASQTDGSGTELGFWWALVPSGTSGTIEVSFAPDALVNSILVNVFRVTGADTATPVASTATDDTLGTPSQDITIPVNGALVAGVCARKTLSAPTFVGWVNATSDGSNSGFINSNAIALKIETASEASAGTPTVSAVWVDATGVMFLGLVALQEVQPQPETRLLTKQLRY